AGVHVGGIAGLVLATQNAGDSRGEAAQSHATCVDHPPLASGKRVSGFDGAGTHTIAGAILLTGLLPAKVGFTSFRPSSRQARRPLSVSPPAAEGVGEGPGSQNPLPAAPARLGRTAKSAVERRPGQRPGRGAAPRPQPPTLVMAAADVCREGGCDER